MSITVVAAFLRIGTKYEIEILRTEGIKRLFYEYPSNMSDYYGIDAWSRIDNSDWVDIDAANLAREQNLLSSLPAALYLICSGYDAEGLITGIERNDGTIAKISPTGLITCLAARESLAKLQKQTTFAWADSPASIYSSCKTPQKCVESRTQIMLGLFLPPASICGLDHWRYGSTGHLVKGMCTRCIKVAEKLHIDGRTDFWNALPGIFGLPEWDELNKEREEFAW